MEEKIIQHFGHQHPLILIENVGNKEGLYCYGCHKPVILESAYVCVQQNNCRGSSASILHKRCGELPRQILHPLHLHHPLHLFYYVEERFSCDLCRGTLKGMLGYRCSSCDFDVDITCQQSHGWIEEKTLQHPSHHHPLTLMRKLPPLIFNCDGCGTKDQDMAYICSTCEFWIHESCASLPTTIQTNHHHHQLSLAFCCPFEHRNFNYYCRVCWEELRIMNWVYYCGDCRYFAHVKCATKEIIPPQSSSNLSIEKNDDSGLIQFPVHDMSKELIVPFIIRSKNGADKIPADVKDMPASVTMPETTANYSMLFNYHKHPLSLVSEGSTSDELMICDVCVTLIHSPPYYNCASCKYFVHSTCYFLPKALSCPISQVRFPCRRTHQNHKLTAYSSSELDKKGLLYCYLCECQTNGMVYKCEDCRVKMDVKCIALPTSIKHASHPQHKLIKRRKPHLEPYRTCHDCKYTIYRNTVAYYCTDHECDFALDMRCVLRPQSIKHGWDKHPLLLTYDASVDDPSDFYCEICEEEMDTKEWMYRCRECDQSFHTNCLTESGYYRNIKFGRQFEFDYLLHPHPLTFHEVTLKLRCDTCDEDCHGLRGFECASCNYVLCEDCGCKELGKM